MTNAIPSTSSSPRRAYVQPPEPPAYTRLRVCALAGCTNTFRPAVPEQQFCTAVCARIAYSRATTPDAPVMPAATPRHAHPRRSPQTRSRQAQGPARDLSALCEVSPLRDAARSAARQARAARLLQMARVWNDEHHLRAAGIALITLPADLISEIAPGYTAADIERGAAINLLYPAG